MPRKAQGARINGLCAVVSDLADMLSSTLEIYCPDSQQAVEKVRQLQLMAAGLVEEHAGFPIADDVLSTAETGSSEV